MNQEALERYEALLFELEEGKREADVAWLLFLQKFGELIEGSFALEISCIRLKKMIAFCQRRENREEPISQSQLNHFISATMAEYEKQLQALRSERAAAKEGFYRIPLLEDNQVRDIYRRLAKSLHPDLHPALYAHPDIQKIYLEANEAFRRGDLGTLEELEVKAAVLVKRYEGTAIQLEIPDIESKISEVKAKIQKVVTTDPYLYKDWINDEEACASEKKRLEEKIAAGKDYEAELKKVLSKFSIAKGEA